MAVDYQVAVSDRCYSADRTLYTWFGLALFPGVLAGLLVSYFCEVPYFSAFPLSVVSAISLLTAHLSFKVLERTVMVNLLEDRLHSIENESVREDIKQGTPVCSTSAIPPLREYYYIQYRYSETVKLLASLSGEVIVSGLFSAVVLALNFVTHVEDSAGGSSLSASGVKYAEVISVIPLIVLILRIAWRVLDAWKDNHSVVHRTT